ncbi:hypothetical protein PF005_g12674 [Phytophthora fragariae]|uniref:Uncharacterized protein n=1 Tax=Phytophthora fragariae TaxID=53985 RepID=A0A6A3S7H2_9STRA|nr:hypothetical protein PF003_g20102 [Phytophthora fragariae]KAE8936400.1 hypothetical protein PF009_g13669 [Phytophthora fragariae]KAE8991773.1 hypothetical protein PF011_g17811 [Phytophthora fragariae]KAE9108214.1 hypothetical protein PF010_g11982 [Phytophthora fragariae]KAE9111451.1 hypothetical protein PF007_g11476 [Phytophthora fragariae]
MTAALATPVHTAASALVGLLGTSASCDPVTHLELQPLTLVQPRTMRSNDAS